MVLLISMAFAVAGVAAGDVGGEGGVDDDTAGGRRRR